LDLRQSDVGAKADVSRASIGEHERGRIEGATVSALRRHAEALNVSLEIVLRGPAGQLAQDEEHALLTQWVKRRLESNRWETEAEASYSIYGERGRIDLLGWRADRRAVLIDEQKTDVPDVQDLLGTLDAKERLATRIAHERGWEADSVGVLLVITRTSRNVAIVQRFAGLFSRYSMRGSAADRWLRDPVGPARMLVFVPPKAVGQRAWRTGRRRVSRPRTGLRKAYMAGTNSTVAASPSANASVSSATVGRTTQR